MAEFELPEGFSLSAPAQNVANQSAEFDLPEGFQLEPPTTLNKAANLADEWINRPVEAFGNKFATGLLKVPAGYEQITEKPLLGRAGPLEQAVVAREEAYNRAGVKRSLAEKLAGGIGDIAGQVGGLGVALYGASKVPGVGKVLSALSRPGILTGGLTGAAQGATSYVPEGDSRLMATLFSSTLGPAVGGLAKGLKEFNISKQIDSMANTLGNKVEEFKNSIGKNVSNPGKAVQNTIKKYVDDIESFANEESAPLYQKAREKILNPQDKQAIFAGTPSLQDKFNTMLKSPDWATQFNKEPPGSIAQLDIFKRYLDDNINKAVRNNEKNLAGILINEKKDLVAKLDELSPEYKQAREIQAAKFAEIGDVDATSLVRRIQKMDDVELGGVAKKLVPVDEDAAESLSKVRQLIIDKNPDAWDNIVRRRVEQLYDKSNEASNGIQTGNLLFTNKATVKALQEAFPGASNAAKRQQIQDLAVVSNKLKNVFNNTLNLQAFNQTQGLKAVWAFLTGRNEKLIAELATSPSYQRAMKDVASTKSPYELIDKMAILLQRGGIAAGAPIAAEFR